jgi:hypothetical protein
MSGDTISGNTAARDGGGVGVVSRGTFIMSGGTIKVPRSPSGQRAFSS